MCTNGDALALPRQHNILDVKTLHFLFVCFSVRDFFFFFWPKSTLFSRPVLKVPCWGVCGLYTGSGSTLRPPGDSSARSTLPLAPRSRPSGGASARSKLGLVLNSSPPGGANAGFTLELAPRPRPLCGASTTSNKVSRSALKAPWRDVRGRYTGTTRR